jgi:crotonobetainyl-CoA:carnitine CoA-transferase CaiB-like acyl-CoA transferase
MRTGDESLIKALTNLFSSKNARQWQSLLGHLGCVQADGPAPNQFWTENEQVKAMHLTSEVEHPAWGRYHRHGAVVMFDGKQQSLAAPPLAGQHNSALLSQLGYSKAQIDTLYQQGTLWQEPS